MPSVNLQIQQNRFRANAFELILALLVLLSLLVYSIDLWDILTDDGSNPYKSYYANYGIQIIFVIAFAARLLFLIMFYLIAFKENKSKSVQTVYLIAALSIGFLQWFELYYGSTFYYGEVRDKQGLMFPMLASIMFTLFVWKVNIPIPTGKDFIVKCILTLLVHMGAYTFWINIYERWNLSP